MRVASTLSEAVEAADAHAPGTAVDTVAVCVDGGAEVAAADGLGVEEGHDECLVVCRNLCGCEIAGEVISPRSESAQNAGLLLEECQYTLYFLSKLFALESLCFVWLIWITNHGWTAKKERACIKYLVRRRFPPRTNQ